MERFVLKKNTVKRKFSVSSLKDEQIEEAAVDLFRSKEVFAMLPTGYQESLTYQLDATAKEMQLCGC